MEKIWEISFSDGRSPVALTEAELADLTACLSTLATLPPAFRNGCGIGAVSVIPKED